MKQPTPSDAERIQHRILYADTDKMGVVYHAGYLRYCEAGRAEYMRRKGLPYVRIEAKGWILPVIETHLRYVASARYDDVIDIVTWIREVKGASLTFDYRIEKDGLLLVECWTKHTCIDLSGRVVRMPEEIRELFKPVD